MLYNRKYKGDHILVEEMIGLATKTGVSDVKLQMLIPEKIVIHLISSKNSMRVFHVCSICPKLDYILCATRCGVYI